ncbi:hypothetical protein BDB00DRAFT_792488 [Zychaea mexicana]|uniref:uncharacterized protein n=1 Tax=Zychaea mexicana TaxID=64656 RepID=UPI0022FED559|nr:uncharacterized protein BDB00DRAFT_792488 [Zychaea mexicana]KAI9484934.1 hypothetical protein BDB00DRAFT_792488 [Zychaea mexicana]
MDTTTFQSNTGNYSGPIIPYMEAQSSVAMDVNQVQHHEQLEENPSSNPWTPDQQDSADLIKPDQLGPDADLKVVRTYLEQQVHLKEAYLQSLVTCPDQQVFLAAKSDYENWKERLNTMKALSDKTLDDAKVAHLVPKNLPVFNIRGHTKFAPQTQIICPYSDAVRASTSSTEHTLWPLRCHAVHTVEIIYIEWEDIIRQYNDGELTTTTAQLSANCARMNEEHQKKLEEKVKRINHMMEQPTPMDLDVCQQLGRAFSREIMSVNHRASVAMGWNVGTLMSPQFETDWMLTAPIVSSSPRLTRKPTKKKSMVKDLMVELCNNEVDKNLTKFRGKVSRGCQTVA